MTPQLIQRADMRLGYERSDDGFTLVEVVVSLALLMIVFAAVSVEIIGNTRASRATQQRVRAANIAQSYLSSLQASKTLPATLPTAGPDGYTLRVTMSPSTTSICSVGNARSVSILVWAPNATPSALPLVRTDSVIAC